MMLQQFVFTILLLFCCSLPAVFATRACYLCNSYTDNNHDACVDPMSPYPIVTYTFCPDNYVCTRVSYITQKKLVVSRGCDLQGDTCNNIRRSLSAAYPDLSSYNCYQCTDNYCNAASGVQEA